MGLRLAEEGEAFTVYFWEEDSGECPAQEYIEALLRGGAPAAQDATFLRKRVLDLASHGAPTSRQHGHLLQNSDGIHELKAPNGARLFWFYQKGRVVVCSHGVQKPKSYNAHIKRAQSVRASLQAESD